MFRLGLTLLAGVMALSASQQRPVESPRVAALGFALENGLVLPSGPRAIALESVVGLMHTDSVVRAPALDHASEAREMAQLVKQESRVERLADLLKCVRDSCVPAGHESVVVVNDPTSSASGFTVGIRVYMPSDQPLAYDGILSLSAVEVAKRDAGWVGVRYSWGPKATTVILPKK